jgi:hypothetical protein
MFTTRRWITGALALTFAAGACLCEDAVPAKSYKLDFVVKEVQGTKVLNSRTYSTVVSTGRSGRSEIRAGSKLPYISKQGATTEYQQIDVGVSIDTFEVKELDNRLSLAIAVDISSLPEGPSAPTDHPIVRQNKWSSTATVPFKKATPLFSSDNVDSKSEMQVEVTATPLL